MTYIYYTSFGFCLTCLYFIELLCARPDARKVFQPWMLPEDDSADQMFCLPKQHCQATAGHIYRVVIFVSILVFIYDKVTIFLLINNQSTFLFYVQCCLRYLNWLKIA